MGNYCFKCGTKLKIQILENIPREVCPNCGWVYYPHLKVGAGGLVTVNHQLLLVQRAMDPWKESWYIPAGYAEIDETPAQTAEREIWEETGLKVHAKELVNIYFYDDDPRGNGLLVLFNCELISGNIQISNEALDARFFAAYELPENLAGVAHIAAVNDWLLKLTESAD